MRAPRIALFGGTFDPVHAGHLDLALACQAELELDEVRFLTAHVPPHKAGAHASGIHRHAMVALALAEEDRLSADPRELERQGRSYTVDTLTRFRAEHPQAELFFLAGADSLRDLATWREPDRILELATFVAVGRSGLQLDEAAADHALAIEAGRIRLLRHEPPPWSSTALRALLARGDAPLAGTLSPAVFRYIRKTGLYAPAPQGSPS